MARSEYLKLAQDEKSIFRNFTGGTITCDMPNPNLYSFQGSIKMPNGELIALTNECLLLKGC
jgi:hypothetical protein